MNTIGKMNKTVGYVQLFKLQSERKTTAVFIVVTLLLPFWSAAALPILKAIILLDDG